MCIFVFLICQFITQTSEALNDSAFGFNASAEGGDEQGGDQADSVSGCNIVLANRLVETTFKQKDYQKHIKVLLVLRVCSFMQLIQFVHG